MAQPENEYICECCKEIVVESDTISPIAQQHICTACYWRGIVWAGKIALDIEKGIEKFRKNKQDVQNKNAT